MKSAENCIVLPVTKTNKKQLKKEQQQKSEHVSSIIQRLLSAMMMDGASSTALFCVCTPLLHPEHGMYLVEWNTDTYWSRRLLLHHLRDYTPTPAGKCRLCGRKQNLTVGSPRQSSSTRKNDTMRAFQRPAACTYCRHGSFLRQKEKNHAHHYTPKIKK